MKLIRTEAVEHLELPPGHRFPLAKYTALEALLGNEFPGEMLLGAPASREDIQLIHDPGYVRDVFEGSLSTSAVRRLGFPWSRSLVLRATRSVGGTLAALTWALSFGAAGHLAGGTHHGFRERGEGFCVFNDLAVAIAVARRDFGIGKVAVVDLDVHQGNGTAAIFAQDPGVFTLSLHGARNYPFVKEQSSLDLALPDGCADGAYLEALDRGLDAVVRFAPELVLYQAGVDALVGDSLGRMALSLDGLARRDARVFAAVRGMGVPVVVTLGGGYGRDLTQTVAAHANVFRALVRTAATATRASG
jgi:acetoin utilization deacetylase AcuC-like enzyme